MAGVIRSSRPVGRPQTGGVSSIELRPVASEQVEELCALTNRSQQFDGVPRVLTVEELLEDLERPYHDLALDARAAYRDGELAGWARVWNPPSEASQERAYLLGEVDPAHRCQGVGRLLLGWSLARAEERLRSRAHDLPRFVRVDAFDSIEANHRLYARLDFTPVRWFEEQRRPLVDLPVVAVPRGAVLASWPDDRDEEIWAVHNATFVDHWGSAPTTSEDWSQAVRGHGARPDLSTVALDADTGAVVAHCLNHAYPEDDELTGRREAWIDSVGTLRDWRRRGLASAMIAWSMEAFAAAGFTHAMLGVDTDNPTGAARLYRDLGFEPERRSITYQIEVAI